MDDTPEIHAVRLKEYETYVAPMVQKLRIEDRITEVNGMKPIEAVFADMESIVRANILDPEVRLPAMARR